MSEALPATAQRLFSDDPRRGAPAAGLDVLAPQPAPRDPLDPAPDAAPEPAAIAPDRLQEIRAEIDAGRYLDDAKLEIVVDRLLDELQRD